MIIYTTVQMGFHKGFEQWTTWSTINQEYASQQTVAPSSVCFETQFKTQKMIYVLVITLGAFTIRTKLYLYTYMQV